LPRIASHCLALPRIASLGGKGVGTQPVETTADTLPWQCHIVDNSYRSPYKAPELQQRCSRANSYAYVGLAHADGGGLVFKVVVLGSKLVGRCLRWWFWGQNS